MRDEVKEALEEVEAKMSEMAMLKIFKLNCEKFGFIVAMKGLLAFMDDIDDVIDEKKTEE